MGGFFFLQTNNRNLVFYTSSRVTLHKLLNWVIILKKIIAQSYKTCAQQKPLSNYFLHGKYFILVTRQSRRQI